MHGDEQVSKSPIFMQEEEVKTKILIQKRFNNVSKNLYKLLNFEKKVIFLFCTTDWKRKKYKISNRE